MAVFIDIRNKLGPIIVILIGLSLALFVLETALNSNSSLLRGNKDVVGIIDGEKIHYNDYLTQVDKITLNYKLNSNGQPMTEVTTYQLRDQAWNQMINDKINNDLYDKLGISVSDAEKKDLFFGSDPHPEIKKNFTNPQTGIFDPSRVKYWIEHLDKSENGEDVAEKRMRWVNFETYVNDDRLQTKLRTAFKQGIYIPKWMAEDNYTNKNTKLNFDYVAIPYSTIVDSTIKVTDAELQAYINENKEKYKQEESRKLEFVTFKVNPTLEDTLAARKIIEEATTKLSEAVPDTNYIKMNADHGIQKYYFSKDKIAEAPLKDTLMKVTPGVAIGPLYKDGTFYTARVVDRRIMPDSVKTSFIAFARQGVTDTVKLNTKVDSVFNALKSGASFEELAKKYSDDKQSGAKGGDIGYAKQGLDPKEINQFLFFDGSQGEIKVIRTANAFFIVKIVESLKINSAVEYYVFSRRVEASSKTDKMVFEQASQFASKNSADNTFTQTFKSDNTLIKQTADIVKKSDYQLQGLENARELVTWAYKSEKGSVSPIIPVNSLNIYVIGHLVDIRAEGTQSVDVLRQQIEPLVRNKKKGEKIAAELAAAAALNSTLESVAAKYGQEVKNMPSFDFAESYLPNIGIDNALIGTVAALKENEISKPIIGTGNVFIVKMNTVSKPQPIADYKSVKDELSRNIVPRVQYGVTEALKKTMKIDDLRYNFF